MTCQKCGAELNAGETYCTRCGAAVEPEGARMTSEQYSALRGKMIASMVTGILSLVFAWFGWSAIIALALAITGLVLGIQARKAAPAGMPTGMATAGVACSVAGIVIASAAFVGCLLCTGVLGLAGMAAL